MKPRHFVVMGLLALPLLATRFWRSERSDAAAIAEAGAGERGDSARAEPPDGAQALVSVTGPELLAEIQRRGGKGSLVNVWATWCGPCKRELPMLVSLAERLGELGISLLLVSVDEPAQAQAVADLLAQHSAPLPGYLVRGDLEHFKRDLNPRWAGMLPASFLFDSSGKLRHFWGGEVFEEELVPLVSDFVAGKDIDAETTFGLAPGRVDAEPPSVDR